MGKLQQAAFFSLYVACFEEKDTRKAEQKNHN
jgi:hypothetical protein